VPHKTILAENTHDNWKAACLTNILLKTILGIGFFFILICLLLYAFESWNTDIIIATGIIGLFFLVAGGIILDREK